MIEQINKTYTIQRVHEAVIKQVAKDHGATSESAALRYIIDKYVEYEQKYGNGRKANETPTTPQEM